MSLKAHDLDDVLSDVGAFASGAGKRISHAIAVESKAVEVCILPVYLELAPSAVFKP